MVVRSKIKILKSRLIGINKQSSMDLLYQYIDTIIDMSQKIPNKSELKERLVNLLSGANPDTQLISGYEEDLNQILAAVKDLGNVLIDLKENNPDKTLDDWSDIVMRQ